MLQAIHSMRLQLFSASHPPWCCTAPTLHNRNPLCRQAAQCVGRVIRSKGDYGLMVFADKRYSRHDKRDKLPGWITAQLRDSHMSLSTDMLMTVTREFMRSMAQPYDRLQIGKALLSADAVNALDEAWRGSQQGQQQQQGQGQQQLGGVQRPLIQAGPRAMEVG